MRRERIAPRPDWKARCEEVGFDFHSLDGHYWSDDVCYRFSADEVDRIEAASAELHGMSKELVADVVQRGDYHPYDLSPFACSLIERSWNEHEPSLYGRFDLAYDGTDLKLYEYNADTPTGLLESAVVQWHWLEDQGLPDQFNSLHEKLIGRWQEVAKFIPRNYRLYFTAADGQTSEDWCNLHYLLDTAVQAGIDCSWIQIESIGWDGDVFLDAEGEPIRTCFKLYPWEWLMAEEFGPHIARSGIRFFEPAWKILLSTKALLPLLWERHAGHPLLLPAYFDRQPPPDKSRGRWVRKPLLSREGANITLLEEGVARPLSGSHRVDAYDTGYVLQRWFDLPSFDGWRPVIGAWIVGDEPAGMGIREEKSEVTGNGSCFVPHYFE